MHRVQHDGFVMFTLGDDPQPPARKPPRKAPTPRVTPVSASRSRIAEHGGAILAGHAAIAGERHALWKVAAPTMILILALSGPRAQRVVHVGAQAGSGGLLAAVRLLAKAGGRGMKMHALPANAST